MSLPSARRLNFFGVMDWAVMHYRSSTRRWCLPSCCMHLPRLVGFRYRGWQAADWSIPASRSKTQVHSTCIALMNDDPTVSQCATDADDTLQSCVGVWSSRAPPRATPPDRTSHSYSLRPRRHDCSLTIKADSRNFITRQLFKDMY